jgi:dihydrofolate reductase
MSMSLDGFIAGPNERPDNGLGDGGERLHQWTPLGSNDLTTALAQLSGANRTVVDEFMSTGAVVAGRGTFEPAKGWGGDHHDGVPIFILSRSEAPEWAAGWPTVRFIDDLGRAVGDAKAEAGSKNVLVHGAGIAQRAIKAGLLDEMEIHLIPVILGAGRPLFENLGTELRELDRVRVLEGDGGVTHLRYRIRH